MTPNIQRSKEDGFAAIAKEVMAGIEREVKHMEQIGDVDAISENYLNLVNFYVLDTSERRIQSKIRDLLKGTELENVSEQAQVIVTLEDDAKEIIKQQMQEQFIRICLDMPKSQREFVKYKRFLRSHVSFPEEEYVGEASNHSRLNRSMGSRFTGQNEVSLETKVFARTDGRVSLAASAHAASA